MKARHLWPTVLLAALALAACRGSQTTAVTPTSRTSPLESPLPTETPEREPPEPTTDVTPTQTAVPTPASDTAVVAGTVETEDLGDPMQGVQVFLGEPIGSGSEEPVFGLDPASAPGAQTDVEGHFVISDVPPGDYGIILWSPVNSILARDPETGDALRVSVDAGDVVDVGTPVSYTHLRAHET